MLITELGVMILECMLYMVNLGPSCSQLISSILYVSLTKPRPLTTMYLQTHNLKPLVSCL